MWVFGTNQRTGLDDAFQQRAFREVRGFFDAPMDVKKSAHISNTPYFQGYTLPTPADRGHGQVIENFNMGLSKSRYALMTTSRNRFTNDYSVAPTHGRKPIHCLAFNR